MMCSCFVVSDILFVCASVKGEALRQGLLTRYYGKMPPRNPKDGPGTGTVARTSPSSSGHESERGMVMLSRAEMTLHDVQVLWFFAAILALVEESLLTRFAMTFLL